MCSSRSEFNGNIPLAIDDPEVYSIVSKEKNRQKTGLELIASEVRVMITSDLAVKRLMMCQRSSTDLYSQHDHLDSQTERVACLAKLQAFWIW